jgi:hypothetical protein
LPESLREDLLRMARQGNASALRDRLRAAHLELPAHGAALQLLQGCADRFDFQALAGHLRETEHAAPT